LTVVLFLHVAVNIIYYQVISQEIKSRSLKIANWTTEQVVEWLKKEGFEQFIQSFKGKYISESKE